MTISIVKVAASQAKALEGRAQAKLAQINIIREELSEVIALQSQESAKASEVSDKSGKVALRLYDGQIAGIFSKDEVSALLGDAFGFKMKADGSPSKTPEGQGEQIRKRVVRAVSVADFLQGKADRPAFIGEGLEGDAQSIMSALNNGEISIFTAYNNLGELKEKKESVPAHLDPVKVLKMANELMKEEVAAVIVQSEGLKAAYDTLLKALGVDMSAYETLGEVVEGPTPARKAG